MNCPCRDFSYVTMKPRPSKTFLIVLVIVIQKFGIKFLSQTRLPCFIEFQSLKVIEVGGRLEPHPLHFQPKRLRASSRTCSKGVPSWGFLRNSSARRSSSAFCSGVSS